MEWSIRVKTCQSRKSWKRFDCAVPQRLMAPECEFLGHPQCRTLARWLKMAERVSRCLRQPVVEMPRLLLLASSGELHLDMHPHDSRPSGTRRLPEHASKTSYVGFLLILLRNEP